MLIVRVPMGCPAERLHAVALTLGDLLKLPWSCAAEERDDIVIQREGDPSRGLRMPDVFFARAESGWLGAGSLPEEPLRTLALEDRELQIRIGAGSLPVLYGEVEDQRLWTIGPEGGELALDVFGSVFFLLSRYEEAALPAEDLHGRFPASASLAFRQDFLEQPLADEYAAVLRWSLERLWPDLERKEYRFELWLTHDVDRPYRYRGLPFLQMARRAFLESRGNGAWGSPLEQWRAWRSINSARAQADPFNTFDWLMETSERHGLRGGFFFLAGRTSRRYDASYEIDDPGIRRLIRRIAERGHEIGLHPSYGAMDRPGTIRQEFGRLRAVCAQEGATQEKWGSRQHYLRIRVPEVLRELEESGLDYDATLGFADHAGFRCATSHEFTPYDLRERRPMRIRERPLVAMECTILSDAYMGLGVSDRALEKLLRLKAACNRFGGRFTLLWHNNWFVEEGARELYSAIVEG